MGKIIGYSEIDGNCRQCRKQVTIKIATGGIVLINTGGFLDRNINLLCLFTQLRVILSALIVVIIIFSSQKKFIGGDSETKNRNAYY
jgi:hypothetical protein